MKPMFKFVPSIIVVVFLLSIIYSTICFSQDSCAFASQGVTELGGSISLQFTTPVYNGETGDPLTVFSLAPYIGHFVANNLEIGVNPLNISMYDLGGGSVIQLFFLGSCAYYFPTEKIARPFIEALAGYTTLSNGTTRNGPAWGGRLGFKIPFTKSGLINVGFQYLQITLNPPGASKRSGSNQYNLNVGYTLWM